MKAETIQKATALIQVNRGGKWESNGACFKIPAFSTDRTGGSFYATAYHTVREYPGSLQVVHVRSESTPAAILAYDAGSDIAILETTSATSPLPISCAKDLEGGNVALLGFPRVFNRQAFTRAQWREVHRDNEETPAVVAVYCDEIATSAPSLISLEDPHSQWRGLSGGPCLLIKPEAQNEYAYALGIVRETSPRGSAGRVYCASIEALESLCSTAGLLLEITESLRPYEELPRAVIGETLRNLALPGREQRAWQSISNVFFHSTGILDELREVIRAPSQYGLTEEDIPFVHYFVARLELKKGRTRLAEDHLLSANLAAARIDPSAGRRLRALIAARRAAEQPLSAGWQQQLRRLLDARQFLEDLADVSDSYKYSELASLSGWQANKFFTRVAKFPPEAVTEVSKLARSHREMLRKLRDARANQEVVSTALEILALLWTAPAGANGDLEGPVSSGFLLARCMRNSIFYVQMILARATYHCQAHELRDAIALIMVVAELMKSHRLTWEHEGISQLTVFLESRFPNFAALFFAMLKWRESTAWPDKVDDVVKAGFDRSAASRSLALGQEWLNALRDYQFIFDAPPSLLSA